MILLFLHLRKDCFSLKSTSLPPCILLIINAVNYLIVFKYNGRYSRLQLSETLIFLTSNKKYFFYFTYFSYFGNIYIKKHINMKNYKRQYRQLSDETKSKISTSSRNKPKSEIHKQRIKQSMLQYWRTVENKPDSLSMDDYLNKNSGKK